MSGRAFARSGSLLILGGFWGASCVDVVVIGDEVGFLPAENGGEGGRSDSPSGGDGPGGLGGEESDPSERPVFQAPRLVSELSDPDAKDQDPTLTGDLLEIYFFSDRSGNAELWTSRRESRGSAWDAPTQVIELASPELDINPAVSSDGLRLWFHSQREPVGIWFTERGSREEAWGPPENLEVFRGEIAPAPSADELRMGISVILEGEDQRDIHESTRQSREEPWGEAVDLLGINTDADDSTPFLIGDGRRILFSSSRTGAGDLYFAWRPSLSGPVDEPVALSELNDPDALESHPHLSLDGSVLFFGSARSGNTDIYEAELAP